MRKNNFKNLTGNLVMLSTAAVFSALSFLAGCSSSNANGMQEDIVQGRPVKVIMITGTETTETRTFPGIVKADREIDLAFRVGGPLIEYDMDIGEQVQKGEVLARIDPRDFEVRIKKLSAELKAAGARLADAERNFERQKNLLQESAASQSQYDKTLMLVETTRAGIESLTADLAAAKNAMADTRLTAPFDGVVNRKFAENHETVAPGVPVVSLLDVSAIEVATTVPEDILIREADVAEIYATLDALPDRKIAASLKEIGRQTDSANQSYPMAVVLQAPKTVTVTPGMAASVYLVLRDPDQVDGGVYLPTTAVFADANGDTCIWRVKPDAPDTEKVTVETGALRGDEILVTSGLDAGDQVVSAGARFLVEGQKIRIIEGRTGDAS